MKPGFTFLLAVIGFVLLVSCNLSPAWATGLQLEPGKTLILSLHNNFAMEDGGSFQRTNEKTLRKYFDKNLTRLFLAHKTCTESLDGDDCTVDFDLMICGEWYGEEWFVDPGLLSVSSPDGLTVTMDLKSKGTSIYKLTKEDGQLRISDILCPNPDNAQSHDSLRQILEGE